MSRNHTDLAASVLALALAAVPLAASPASAQEAIMLETIGAVRMASPAEVQRMNADAARQQLPRVRPAPLSRQPTELAR